MRRYKDLLEIKRPFAIFIQPDDGGPGWSAKIVGFELDQVTYADTPDDAAFMASDLLRVLTGGCRPTDPTPHDWSIDTTLELFDEPKGSGPPAWECSRCGERALKTGFEETDHEPTVTWRPIVPYNDEDGGDCMMTIEEFIQAVSAGAYTEDDGFGECATSTRVSNCRIYPSLLDRPSWATHVCWYNK